MWIVALLCRVPLLSSLFPSTLPASFLPFSLPSLLPSPLPICALFVCLQCKFPYSTGFRTRRRCCCCSSLPIVVCALCILSTALYARIRSCLPDWAKGERSRGEGGRLEILLRSTVSNEACSHRCCCCCSSLSVIHRNYK